MEVEGGGRGEKGWGEGKEEGRAGDRLVLHTPRSVYPGNMLAYINLYFYRLAKTSGFM